MARLAGKVAIVTGAGALLLGLRARLLLPAVVCFLLALLVVLVRWPEVNALAAIGPHPDGGGRFYGVTNEVETLLLAPSLAAAALAGIAGALGVGALLLVTVGCTGASYELAPLFGDDIAWRSRWHDIGPSALSQLRYHLGRAGNGRRRPGVATIAALARKMLGGTCLTGGVATPVTVLW